MPLALSAKFCDIVVTPIILTLSKFVCPSTSISPLISKLPKVPTPTAETPAPTWIPFCAVIIPTESILVTSS